MFCDSQKIAATNLAATYPQTSRRPPSYVRPPDKLPRGVADCYVGGPEAAGEWLGRSAPSLGLSGRVIDRDLRATLDGLDPATRTQLRTSRGTTVPDFALTFSAPTSVSVLSGSGNAATEADPGGA